MKGTWQLFTLFLTWQRIAFWFTCMGLGLLLAASFTTPLHYPLARGLAAWAFLLAVALPFVLSPIIFRQLIAQRRLSHLPCFHLQAGIALLVGTALFALCIPLMNLLTGEALPPLWLPVTAFIIGSAYVGGMQPILTSPYQAYLFSVIPFAVFLIINRFGSELLPLVQSLQVLVAALIICLLGWLAGLYYLARHQHYRPIIKLNSEDWLYLDGGWWRRWTFNRITTPAGTVLRGYSDSMHLRLFRVLNFILIAPLACTLMVMAMGLPEQVDDNHPFRNPITTFLLFAFYSSLLSTWNLSERVARARLLWLRVDNSRAESWRLLEKSVLSDLGLLYLLMCLPVFLSGLTDVMSLSTALHVMALLISRTLFDVYASVLLRALHCRGFIIAFVSIASLTGMIIVLFQAWHWQNPVLLTVLSLVQFLLAAGCRQAARQAYLRIDWLQARLQTSMRSMNAS